MVAEVRLNYWVTDQAEYSSDVLFKTKSALSHWYPRMLDHAVVHFSAADIMTFLERKLHGNFQGEVVTQGKKSRVPGARVKHRVKENWIKMYDKFGQVLRVETVINSPREFKVRRTRTRNGQRQKLWCPMNKGVANLGSYQRVCRAANERYLNALAVVANPTPSYQQVAHVTEPKTYHGRRYAGFNPARGQDVELFKAVLAGGHAIHGFRNADIRDQVKGKFTNRDAERKAANATSRLLKRLHVRGLIAKIPRSRRWKVTTKGQSVLGAIVKLHYHGLSQTS